MGGFELAVAERLASLGLRTGAAFKFMRKALGLRAVDLAELLTDEDSSSRGVKLSNGRKYKFEWRF
jgi:hypothetical protein